MGNVVLKVEVRGWRFEVGSSRLEVRGWKFEVDRDVSLFLLLGLYSKLPDNTIVP